MRVNTPGMGDRLLPLPEELPCPLPATPPSCHPAYYSPLSPAVSSRWDSELEQHRRSCRGGWKQAGGRRMGLGLPWQHCHVPFACPTLPSTARKQHQDGVACLVLAKEETHGSLYF